MAIVWPPRQSILLVALVLIAGLWCITDAKPVRAQTVRDDFDITDGPVHAVALSGNTLYLGGAFANVGQAAGTGVPILKTTGLPAVGFPLVVGGILDAAADGSGGWYVVGGLTWVGGLPRTYLAHILADNSVADWNPGANNGVCAVVVKGDLVYVTAVQDNPPRCSPLLNSAL